MDTELFKEWFQAFAQNAGLTLHVENLYGENNHHIVESCFKALARALRHAIEIDPRKSDSVPSTKGTLGASLAKTHDGRGHRLWRGQSEIRRQGLGPCRQGERRRRSSSPPIPMSSRSAERIVLPGVGAFAECKRGLEAAPGGVAAMREAVLDKGRPFLGICVGMQLMASVGVEYGEHPGLDWIKGRVVKLTPADRRSEDSADGLERSSPAPSRASDLQPA